MKCPICIQEGKKSTTQSHGGTSTLMSYQSFYDEEGKNHHHDRNTSSYSYSCSNGHSYTVNRQGSCWCGWNKDQRPMVTKSSGERITDPEVLKAMVGEPTDFSILSGGRHGCGND